jgi:arginine-tRNA-protein transferase
MLVIHRNVTDCCPCPYLGEQKQRLEYAFVLTLTAAEYGQMMDQRWRRFGRTLFRPVCPSCAECRPLRIVVSRFRPNRSQKRAGKLNDRDVVLSIGKPRCDANRLDLHARYHAHQAVAKDWPLIRSYSSRNYYADFVDNPFCTWEFAYTLQDRLIGVGYVDEVPDGLSAIYFFYDPQEQKRSLGTYNVLSIIREAARRRLPYVYLGYYVAACRSLAYKANFRPNQLLEAEGVWRDFRNG